VNLCVEDTTVREADGKAATFPASLRVLIHQAVGRIGADELPALLGKHETDAENFDSKIEACLRDLKPSIRIRANCRISNRTRFNNDLALETDHELVCLEIEKGYLSRFELDILKMQAFASTRRQDGERRPIFGAFIVPSYNIVANHISGNSRESSYGYLVRLARLVIQIQPLHIDDLLIVGYATPDQQTVAGTKTRRSRTPRAASPADIVVRDRGMLAKDVVDAGLSGYATRSLHILRNALGKGRPRIREKLNSRGRYLGYGLVGGPDQLYVYVQRKGLVIDIAISGDRANELREKGFAIHARNNFQSRAGWLTGLFVPHDSARLADVASLAREALSTRGNPRLRG